MANVNLFIGNKKDYDFCKDFFSGTGDSAFYADRTDDTQMCITFAEESNPEALQEAIKAELNQYSVTDYSFKSQLKRLVLDAGRDAYSLSDIDSTMTVGELKRYLEQFDDDAKFYLSHDGGYTYGAVIADRFDDRYAY